MQGQDITTYCVSSTPEYKTAKLAVSLVMRSAMAIGSSAVRVNAVLAAFRDNENSDVIDALSYFFVPIVDKLSGKPITASLLAKAGKLIYGWNLTESVGQVFIERLIQQGHLKPEDRGTQKVLIAQASPNLTGNFDNAIKESFEKVIDLFSEFDLISGDLIYRQLTHEQLGDLLVRFLVSLGVYSNEDIAAELKSGKSVNGERDALQTLSNDLSVLSRSETHVCARFVQWLNVEMPELAAKLSNFVAAGLLAELVEDFRKPATMETKSNTTFFLDGPMLLGLVGTSGTALQEEARTIVAALKSIGCQVQVFSESCREAERVLVSYLRASPSDRHGRTHSAVLKREVERAYVQVVAADVEKAAQAFGVGIRDHSLDAYPNDHSFFDRDRNSDIYSYLAWENPLAREHDAFAVTAVMRMRRGRHKNDPLQNSHVFISSNEKLVEKSRRYCIESQLIRETQCGPVVDTRDLATIAWLRTGFENSEKLPIAHMLAQCERVLRVRKDVIENARAQVAKFSPERIEQFELLLQDNRAVNYLMDTARGSSAKFDPDTDQELLDGMLEAAIKVAKDDAARQISEKDKAIRTLKKEYKDAQEKWAAEQAQSNEQRERDVAEIAETLAALEEQRRKDSAALSDFHSRQELHLVRGVARANMAISISQLLLGLLISGLGLVASYGAVISSPPLWVGYALKGFTVIGVILTVQALRGKGVLGLSHLSEAVGRRLFLRYVRDKGVPEQIAMDRVSLENGRLQLRDECEVLAFEGLPDDAE